MSLRPEQQAFALVERWRDGFVNVMEAMADVRPVMELDPAPPADGPSLLWWKQNFDLAPRATVWIGTPEETWTALAQQTLAAAGIDSAPEEEQKGTYLEVLRQSLGGLASSIGNQLGRDVTCTDGGEQPPAQDQGMGCRMSISLGGRTLPHLAMVLSTEMLVAAPAADEAAPQAATGSTQPAAGGGNQIALSAQASSTLDLLMDVEMPVCVSFGRTQVRIQDILKLIIGSIIEMDRSISEPVEIIVNNCVIARGEVVVSEGNYGVRIREVMSRLDRLQETRKYLLPVSTSRH